MSRRSVWCVHALLILALGAAQAGFAGEQSDIRGMGMARASAASSVGYDAIGENPANLVLPENGTVVIGFLRFGVHVGTDMTSYGIFRKYFNGIETATGREPRYLNDEDKQAILNGFAGSTGRIASDFEFRPLGVAVHLPKLGSFALTMTDRVAMMGDIPRAYAEFLLYGNPPGSVYDFSKTKAQASWLREYALSYARTLPSPAFVSSLTGGVTLKLIHGFGYASLEHTNTRFETALNGALHGQVGMKSQTAGIGLLQAMSDSGDVTFFPAPAGTGFGVDLGVNAEVNEFLRVGIAVTDIGAVSWDKDIEVATVDSTITIDNATVDTQRKSIENAFHGTHGPGDPFSTSLPTTLRIGGSVELHRLPWVKRILFGEMTVAADMAVGFKDVPGTSTSPRFALGVEYRPLAFLPIRMGGSLGGETHSNFSLGFGLRLGGFDFDLATENVGWIFNRDNLQAASVALGFKIRV